MPTYTPEQLENIDPPPIEYNGKTLTYYECTQKQRTMETAMRKTKREIIAAKASGDEDMFTAKSILLRRQKEEYAKFSKSANMLTQNERTQVYGFDRSVSAKAAWAVKKAQNTSGGSPASSGGKAVTLDVPAPANVGKVYTDEKIVKPLDNSGGNGIMKSKGFDFLDGVLGSDKIPKEQSKSLDEIVSVIPKKHLDVIGKTVSEVEIVPNRGRCSYEPDSKKLILDPDKMNGSIIHEFGHVLADAYDLYNDKEFIDILSDGLDLSNFGETVYIENPNIKGQFIFALPADKFINAYQGRIYVDTVDDWNLPIPANRMYEYFSVGFDAYFNKADELKSKDIRLYNFIKEILHNE